MADKKKKNYGQSLKNNWFILKLSFQASPLYMFDMLFEAMKQQGLNFLEHTLGIYVILDAVEHQRDYMHVVRFIGIIIGCWMVSFFLSAIFNHLVGIKGMARCLMKLRMMLYDKAKDMDLSCYDDPK